MTGAAAALRARTEGLEPWGSGAVGTAMAAVRDLMGEACAHLRDNLVGTGAARRAMAVEAGLRLLGVSWPDEDEQSRRHPLAMESSNQL
ncbi:hypothetical protein [Nonomuraea jabiensis]|uniref:Uncharacterized protein n=1 Tax=Nonomuraea jabiensis TaxID=882448 RepID=A0A7W9FYE7_9ACTN|nr:hypothetical protein [Nonomuraea jabiensis]MBB5773843.1 hypothetical protein [Nonomuraea jabiensis]